jgi:hypothetical protein
MKYLFFLIFTISVNAQSVSNWALIDANGTVISVLVANDEIASGYPKSIESLYPNSVNCVKTLNAGIGWHYDSTTQTFIAPVITTNNAVALPVVTTNNLSILTTNNSQ